MKKQHTIILLLLWAALAVSAWVSPAQEISQAERRPLAQLPELSGESLLSGEFMAEFADYSLDQFPLRQSLRTVKSLFHTYALGQKDNNGIYFAGNQAVKQEYPLDPDSIAHALDRFQYVYEAYLTDSRIFCAIAPDKGYYLAQDAGQLRLDYDRLYAAVEEGMPWAKHIDLRPVLSGEDYYRTDAHWRQEKLLPAAKVICDALGVSTQTGLREIALTQPFYGVYYGQAALPMVPDELIYLENDLLADCTVYDGETGKTGAVYDMTKLSSGDLYDVYLSGAKALLTIHNDAGQPGKKLTVFRDSFASAMLPLLVADYETVTVIDIRYLQPALLDRFVDFSGQDVLFLYSTTVLNNSNAIK